MNEFLKQNKIKKCLTLDSDVLLFKDIQKDMGKFKEYSITMANKTSGGFMHINNAKIISDLEKFIFDSFNFKKENYLLTFWKDHKAKDWCGGVNDMTVLEEFYKRNPGKIGEITDIINGETYCAGINSSHGYQMENGIKKMIFQKKLPFGVLERNNKKIKFCCLHFAGPTKFYMKYFARGKFNSIDKLKVKTMMFLRNRFSNKLSPNQILFVKKLLVRFRF